MAWLELLSPSNKGSTLDAQPIVQTQTALAERSGFVEIDYLHETPATFEHLADYTRHEDGSHAYRIVVLIPAPTLEPVVWRCTSLT
ncbi:MAG: hypothetical protein R2911_18930 [Caldilineaceae bacterium]